MKIWNYLSINCIVVVVFLNEVKKMSQEIVDFPLDLIDDRHAFTKWANSLKKIDSVKLHEYVIKYAEIIEIRENKEKYAYIDSLPFVMQQEEKEH